MATPLTTKKSLFSLEDKVVLITGGYGHLGRAIVAGLLDQGATVVVLGREEASFNAAFAELEDNSKAHFIPCDVASTHSVKAAFRHSSATVGLPSVLINNAFYSRGNQPESLTDEEFAFGLDGSLGSTYRCIQAIIPFFRESGAGKIINVASMYGIVAPDFGAYTSTPQFTNPPHYGAAKAGVIQLTRYFASYLGKENIQVNCVTPGAFPSQPVQAHEAFVAELTQRIPLGRIGQPEDLQGAFVFLSSQASNFVTGHNLVVDGGWTIR
ncbi:SDR family oxidoreductase [Hymenobacter radiodurans]|uniref:SDR family oxidoreductase n=1 Tax=Hymenobacter radiodurans TaxID=2496028 RepID=UPI001058A705|nr:SDR family oxidoreductase [Hymenobacter radiodurans]